MDPVNDSEKLKISVQVKRLIARSCRPTTKAVSFVLSILVICVIYEFSPNNSPHKYVGVKERRNGIRGRCADDGRWFVQTHPFDLFVYSAFYDSRWSLQGKNDETKWGQVTVVTAAKELTAITHCCLFHGDSSDKDSCLIVEAKSLQFNIICKIPESKGDPKWKAGDGPSAVSLLWGTAANQSTAFRVPVERVMPLNVTINHNTKRPGNIAMCIQQLFGHAIEPNIAIEWLEMMRLLGVEHVVLYNHSVSESLGRAITGYIRSQSVNTSFKVDLRQVWPIRFISKERLTREQIQWVSSNDCYYRLAGRYKWIVSQDMDELLTPRNFSHLNLLQMIQAITDNGKLRVGTLSFQLMHFFQDLNLLNRNDSWDRTSVNGKTVNTSLSYFQTMNLRWNAGPVGFNYKCIHNADGCVVVYVHTCKVFTHAFEKSSKRRTVVHDDGSKTQLLKQFDVPPAVGVIQHYRKTCNLDNLDKFPNWKNVFWQGYCRSQRLYKDNIIAAKYGRKLSERLAVTFGRLNLTAYRFHKLPKK